METMIGGTTAAAPPRGGTARTAGRKGAEGAFAELLETARREATTPEPGTGRTGAETATDAGLSSGPSSLSPANDQVPAEETADEVETVTDAEVTESGEPAQTGAPVAIELDEAVVAEAPADPAATADLEPEKAGLPDAAAWATATEALTSAVVPAADTQVEGVTETAAIAAGPAVALQPMVEEERPEAEEPGSNEESESAEESTAPQDDRRPAATAFVPAGAAQIEGTATRSVEPEGAMATVPAAGTPVSGEVPGPGGDNGHRAKAVDADWSSAADLAFTEVSLSPETVPPGTPLMEPGGVTSLLSPHEWQDPRLTAEPAPTQLLERLQQAVGQERSVAFEQLARTVLPQVTRGIATLVQDGSAEMRLQLRPPELGEIELRVRATDSTVHGQVTVQQPAIKHLLESQLDRLREALAEQGLQLAGFDVGVHRDPRSAPDREETGGAGTGVGAAGAEPTPEIAAVPMRVGGGLHAVDYTI
ncbi:MAG: flagellar hook-length control protein FliK [Candidatus Latescibacterota bacterium]|jgi:flagellar hook-length control protein FliK